ncbi:Polysaccharide biosynthesis/export protein [Jannaschia faecimaris]|uniref:Polysaccharide biosynthesis/export protein n=1 Tax=Jannaschia faecimaris TaxID=1244108 RepID=A0A1H3TVE5_9RHOB|nr:polysaccharide biosynthesis/export family protein [Jannaschia faecimaris]SDZ54174.1 Polysaccharide biosynthesis/export protein [Jannaschia faecimaris]
MILRLLTFAFCAAMSSGAGAQDYALQPGDSVRLFVSGLPGGDMTSIVDMDGNMRFPYVGSIQVAGKTLEQIRAALSLTATGSEVTIYGPNEARSTILLGPDNIFLAMDGYRHVTVGGAVVSPGPVDFSPGMTARAAVASAGGAGTTDGRELSPLDVVSLLGTFDELALDEALELAELWRLDAMLADRAEAPSEITRRIVAEHLGLSYLDQTRDRIGLDLSVQDSSDLQLEEQLELYDQRVSYLERTLAGYEEAARLEAEELARVQEMFDRRVVPIDRLNSARSAGLITNIRVLDTESMLAEARIGRSTLAEELDAGVDEARSALLAERAATYADLVAIRKRMAGARAKIDAAGLSSFMQAATRSVTRVVVYRGAGDAVTRHELALDDPLLPGDVIEVTTEQPIPSQ